MRIDTDVIVVGAGPTGLMLAGELALAGTSVEIVERQRAPSDHSRAGGVNARTAEVLANRGLIDAIAARAVPVENVAWHFAGLPVPLDTRPWRTRYPGGLLVPQHRLEQALEDHLAGLGVAVRRGTELVDLDPGADDAAGVTLAGPSGGYRLRGRYLVACDGGHSTVRALTKVAFPGRAGTLAAVTADVELASRSATVSRSLDHISRLTRTGGGYWMLLHPIDAHEEDTGLYRVVFGGPEQATLPRDAPVTSGEVARALTAVHGAGTRLGRLRGGTRFSDASRQVTDYRVGRVLFAGDAAHIHPPMGGQGLNLGVQDAVNLGWKLATDLRGGAPDGLLDSYHTERHPVGARVIAAVRAQAVLMKPPPDAVETLALRDIVTDLARLPDANRYLAGLMSGLDIRYPHDDPDPLVGARMPDLDLMLAVGARTRVSTLLRSGHGLLLELGGPPERGDPQAADPLPSSVRRVVARPVDGSDDPDGSGSDGTGPAPGIGTDTGAAPGVDRILVRPDGYVCWVGTGSRASPTAALRRWFGAAQMPAQMPA